MAETNRTRRVTLLFVVLGILAALGVVLLVGVILGDDTDGIDPHQGEVATLFLH